MSLNQPRAVPVPSNVGSRVLEGVAVAIWSIVLGVSLAYEGVLSIVLFDGVSIHEMDGGNGAAYGLLLVLLVPVACVLCLCVCFWLRRRVGRLALLAPLAPVALWAIVLGVRFASGDCGDALSRC